MPNPKTPAPKKEDQKDQPEVHPEVPDNPVPLGPPPSPRPKPDPTPEPPDLPGGCERVNSSGGRAARPRRQATRTYKAHPGAGAGQVRRERAIVPQMPTPSMVSARKYLPMCSSSLKI